MVDASVAEIDGVVMVVSRDLHVLTKQIAMIVDFLSDGRTDDDAAATCSPGWRPRD